MRRLALLLLILLKQDPYIEEGYVLPQQAKFIAWNADPKFAPKSELRLGVVLIEFKDQRHHPAATRELVNLMFFSSRQYVNGTGLGQQPFGSVADYFEQNSYGKFKMTGPVFSWVTVDAKWADLRKDEGHTIDVPSLLLQAMDEVTGHEGERAFEDCERLLFIYAGSRGDLTPAHALWPHASEIEYRGRKYAANIFDGGTHAKGRPQEWNGVGVYVHELAHVLGLGDKYGLLASRGVGAWCHMGASRHSIDPEVPTPTGADPHRPFHLCVYCKWALGWINPITLDPRVTQKLALRPIERYPDAFRIPISPDGTEYYLLENRQRRGFDQTIPSAGLIIWRVKQGQIIGASEQRLIEAHGIPSPDSAWRFEQAIAFPTLASTSFTPQTRPASRDVSLTNIRAADNGVVTFDIAGRGDPVTSVSYERKQYRVLTPPASSSKPPLTIAVILVDCDEAPRPEGPLRRFRDFFFEQGPKLPMRSSVRDYFHHASFGRVSIDGGVIPWVKLGSRAEIAKLRSPVETLLARICPWNRRLIDQADLLYIVFAGAPVQKTFFTRQVGTVAHHGREIPFAIIEETAATTDLEPAVRSVFRVLGRMEAPGDRLWCVSGRTNVAANAFRPGPVYPCAWCREQLGWSMPTPMTDPCSYALAPAAAFGGQAVKLPIGDKDYYLIENRASWEFDRGLPREGLVVWHVTPPEAKCTKCAVDRGVIDIWNVHDAKSPNNAGGYVPFVSLVKGLSLRIGKYELMGIEPDDRGNMYFEVALTETQK